MLDSGLYVIYPQNSVVFSSESDLFEYCQMLSEKINEQTVSYFTTIEREKKNRSYYLSRFLFPKGKQNILLDICHVLSTIQQKKERKRPTIYLLVSINKL
mgnify:CR=1 FL=1